VSTKCCGLGLGLRGGLVLGLRGGLRGGLEAAVLSLGIEAESSLRLLGLDSTLNAAFLSFELEFKSIPVAAFLSLGAEVERSLGMFSLGSTLDAAFLSFELEFVSSLGSIPVAAFLSLGAEVERSLERALTSTLDAAFLSFGVDAVLTSLLLLATLVLLTLRGSLDKSPLLVLAAVLKLILRRRCEPPDSALLVLPACEFLGDASLPAVLWLLKFPDDLPLTLLLLLPAELFLVSLFLLSLPAELPLKLILLLPEPTSDRIEG